MENVDFGGMVDQLFSLRAKKRRLQEKIKPEVEQLDEEMSTLEERLQGMMEEAGTMAVRGKKASYTLRHDHIPVVVDWEKFEQWMVRSGNTQCLQRRLSPKAVLEARDNIPRKRVPGLKVETRTAGTLASLRS